MEIKLVKDILTFIYFAKLLFQVISNIQNLAWLTLVSNVPDLDAEVVSRVHVAVVDRRELGATNRVDNIREKVLSGWHLFDHILGAALLELRVDS